MCLKNKGIFRNSAFKSKVLLPLFNSCCSGAMKAGVPMFSEHKTPRFRKRAKPKSDSFLGPTRVCCSHRMRPWGQGETLELKPSGLGHPQDGRIYREKIEWTLPLGINSLQNPPSRMVWFWKIKICLPPFSYVPKPEVESKWRAGLGVEKNL